MKILILGSKGQLGSELQRQLNTTESSLGKIPKEYIAADVLAIDIDTVDISNREQISEYISKNRFDIIFNCAAYTDVDACETNVELAYKVNAFAPGYIAEAAKGVGSRLIHISTDYVFRGSDPIPRNEKDETAPVTVYGKSKLDGENAVINAGADAIIVRTAWLYGLVGRNFVKTIMKIAREKGVLKVVNDQIGNPTSATDLAYHLLRLAVTEYTGIFHCTNNGICSWYEFACEIVKEAQINAEVTPCTTKEFPREAPRPGYSALDNMRLRQTLGDDMRLWNQAIKEYIYELKEAEGGLYE